MADNNYDNDDIDYGADKDPDIEPYDDSEEENDKKKNTIIAVIIVVIIAVIALILFLFNRGGDDEVEEPPAEETSTSTATSTMPEAPGVPDVTGTTEPDEDTAQPTTTGDDPIEAPFDEDRAPEPRYKPEPETPLPTTPNQAHAEAHGAPFDPQSGMPDIISQMVVQNMFTMTVDPDSSFEDNFYKTMEGRMSPTMEATGFKPWWPADGPEHSLAYRGMMNSTEPTKIYAFPEKKSERRIANDIVQFHYEVPQRINSVNGYTNISSFEVVVDMIGEEDGTWLLHDYYFPDGKVPSIY